jgi:hypothetical protein
LLRNGHTLDDIGAGMQHGNLSHRLQFYLLGQYMNNHLDDLFQDTNNLNHVLDELKLKHLDMIDQNNKFPLCKLISAFYRLLGTKEFNECFDWELFKQNRAILNEKYNKQKTPDELNASDIWVQLFDRYGYAGYFSVPSTFGLLQRLGCFANLPALGMPSTSTNKHLKIIIDVTPKI